MKIISIIVSLMAALPSAALAHATLDRAMPPVGSSQTSPPREVVLSFTEDLEPAFSTIEVRSESGALVSSGKARVDSKQRTQMRVPLKSLPPGTYKVIWRVLSVDTHRTNGDFTFKVGP
jgi:copper resistance protein C